MAREQDKLRGDAIVVEGDWKAKLDNFWFYHKWHILIAAFVVFVLTVCLLQSRENKKDDVVLMFAGPYKLTATETAALRTGLNEVMPKDFNEDGEKYAEMVMMQIYSEEQEKAIQATPNGEIPPYLGYIDSYYNDEQITSFDHLIMAGEYSICILDPWLYERVKGAGGLCKLSDVLGSVPSAAVDEYGVLLANTEFAAWYPVCQVFPEGTVICLRNQGVMSSIANKKKSDREYTNAVEMFRALVSETGTALPEAGSEIQ
ncbi:MAG: hypothetical protein IJW99_02935 [Clostridia bacterium]|nr:hypothetical protein [Clostridia bacterium]